MILVLMEARSLATTDRPAMDLCERALTASQFGVVAVDADRQVVGMARVIGDQMYPLIVDVVVHPRAQARGVGTMMLDRIVVWAERTGLSSLCLAADTAVVGFYERRRFIESGRYLRRQSH